MTEVTTSEATNFLFEQFSKAQGAVEDAIADHSVNTGKYTYTYADLKTIWNCCRKALADNGLAVAQFPEVQDKTRVLIHTRIVHASGQWMQGPPISCLSMDAMPQAIGSSITYLKRYALAALMGIAVAEEDDDGGIGSGKDQNKPQGRSQKAAKPPPKPKPDGSQADQAQREQYIKLARDSVIQICGRIEKKDGDEIVKEWQGNVDVLLRYATGGQVDFEKWEAGKSQGNMAQVVAESLVQAMDGRKPTDVLKIAYAWDKEGA